MFSYADVDSGGEVGGIFPWYAIVDLNRWMLLRGWSSCFGGDGGAGCGMYFANARG